MTLLASAIPPRRAASDPPGRSDRAVRVARYLLPGEPPHVDEIVGDDATLIEEVFARAAESCALPALAVREVIENLVHAGFEGACVSILDDGACLRVSDCGPGIPDKDRAMQPGFSTATTEVRRIVRGVGSGLPVAASAMLAAGGALDLEDNLAGGTVVTLSAPEAPATGRQADLGERSRRVMALLVELGSAVPSHIAAELDIALGECGRELVVLEHRGLVERTPDGARRLTPDGTNLLVTLF